ncbi:SLATT domain-containing protein [Buttiauxella noackiae]|uniref:SLATT domain-containing protein n=1 Tax=Buttiauxella noackiae TaxID=82992 RepID=UPI000557DF1F|nr:SLATT domain-containing protein [Buttiauxella noackiae]
MALIDNIWWTRKSRIQTEKRLLANAFQSQLILLWYSFFSVAISIYYIKFSDNDDLSGVSWVIYSVLILCMSGFINALSFKERAGLVKESYEALNLLLQKPAGTVDEKDIITNEYNKLLGVCENHTDVDYYTALCIEYSSSNASIDTRTNLKAGFDRAPGVYHWAQFIFWRIKRVVVLTVLYMIPVFILFAIKYLS